MIKNVGAVDRVIRLLVGIGLVLLGFLFLESWLATISIIFGIVLFITGLASRCGLYYPFGISTCRTTKEN